MYHTHSCQFIRYMKFVTTFTGHYINLDCQYKEEIKIFTIEAHTVWLHADAPCRHTTTDYNSIRDKQMLDLQSIN